VRVAGLGAEVELDGVEAGVAFAQAQLEVLVLEDALLLDFEFVLEQRRREALAPDFVFQQAGGFERDVAAFQRAVGFQRARQVGRGEQFAGDLGEEFAEALEIFALTVTPAAMAWPPKRSSRPGRAWRRGRARRAGAGRDRAAGALDDAAFAGGKGEDRAVQLFLDARGEDADDAFVPAFGSKRAMPGAASLASIDSSRISACSCMPDSISRRSRLSASSCWAMFRARPGRR
jgi:hypothetical protein